MRRSSPSYGKTFMCRLLPSLAVATAIALAGPSASALAQQPGQTGAQSGEETEIVVEGLKERRRQIQRFVGALTDTYVRGQIARFEFEVCPMALGMTDAQNMQVAERIRRIAQAANVPLGERGCDPNAIVIVTPNKPATMRDLRRASPHLFRTALGARIRPNPAEPVSAWQVEGRLTQDGQAVPIVNDDMGTYYRTEVTRASSRLAPATRPHFTASIVVIQLDALRGLTATQLADYAAMRMLARTQPSKLDRSTVPTILNVIDAPMGAEVPVTLTQWDLGFLRALYGSEENRYAEQQRHEMRRLLERDLDPDRQAEAQ